MKLKILTIKPVHFVLCLIPYLLSTLFPLIFSFDRKPARDWSRLRTNSLFTRLLLLTKQIILLKCNYSIKTTHGSMFNHRNERKNMKKEIANPTNKPMKTNPFKVEDVYSREDDLLV